MIHPWSLGIADKSMVLQQLRKCLKSYSNFYILKCVYLSLKATGSPCRDLAAVGSLIGYAPWEKYAN